MDLKGFDFIATVVRSPFPIVGTGRRVGVCSLAPFRAQESKQFASPFDRGFNQIFVPYPKIGKSIVWKALMKIQVDIGPVAVGQPVVYPLGYQRFRFSKGHFSEGCGCCMDVSVKNDVLVVGYIGKPRI